MAAEEPLAISDPATRQTMDDFYFQWHITDRCNFRCKHCYQTDYSAARDLDLENLKLIADKLSDALIKWNVKGKIAITGGEPLLREDLFELLDYLENLDGVQQFEILSNAALLTPDMTERLKAYNRFHSFQVSLDGGTADIHDAMRGDGSFDLALQSIRILRAYAIPVRLMFTIHHGNVQDVPTLIDLAIAEDVDAITIERFVPTGSGADLASLVLSPDEIHSVYKYVAERADREFEVGTGLKILKYRSLWILLDPDRSKIARDSCVHTDLGAMCSIGIDSLCILPDATALPCRRLDIPIGNLLEDSVFKIWYTSDLLWQLRNKNNLKGKCNGCELIPRCGGCRATAYAMTGDYLAEDPQCWS